MKKPTIALVALLMVLAVCAQEKAAPKNAALPALSALDQAKSVASEASATTRAHEAELEIAEETAAGEPLEISEATEPETPASADATPSAADGKKPAKETAAVEQPAAKPDEKPTTPVEAPQQTATQTAAVEQQPAANAAPAPQPQPNALAPNLLNGGQRMVDEVDLEEDDSALAALRPKIKQANEGGADATLVDIDCDNATLADILRQFRKTTGRNIISGESTNLQRRVSVSLRNVPWYQALTAILQARGFRLDKNEGIYRVVEDTQAIKYTMKPFALKHASARELTDLFNKAYSIKDKNGKTIREIATCFESANVVVVIADDKTISACNEIIESIDKSVAQIYIEARFLELSSEAMHKLGLDWSALSSWQFSAKNMSAGWERNSARMNQFPSVKTSGTTTKTVSSEGTSGTSAKDGASEDASESTSESLSDSYTGISPTLKAAEGAGISENSLMWNQVSSFSGQFAADDFSLAISAFEQLGEGKIFSNPKIIVSNGKEAKVDMTTKEPNVSISSDYTGTSSQNLSISTKLEVIPGEDKQMFAKEAFFSYGIELKVRPRISPDGLISVEIVPTISEKKGDKEIAGASTAAPYTTYPIINVKRLTTEFTMKDGSTAVIGGLTQTAEDDVDSGIPYLRKIPWIGPKLFGWKSRQKVQKEIIICVTVGIANPKDLPREIGLPTNAVMGREYVRGERQEPGTREGTSAKILSLDMRPLEEQQADVKKVTISIPDDEIQATSPSGSVRISRTK